MVAIDHQFLSVKAAQAYAVAAAVVDPELPFLTIEDLGILRGLDEEGDEVVAHLAPTYSGCPAASVIELAVETALLQAGFVPRIKREMLPAWSSDWITETGRQKLLENGIAPPQKTSGKHALFSKEVISCPACGVTNTTKISEFGSTACKAHYRCDTCLEPFDYFKCI